MKVAKTVANHSHGEGRSCTEANEIESFRSYLGNQMAHFKSRSNATVVCDITRVKIPLWAVAVGRWKVEGKD